MPEQQDRSGLIREFCSLSLEKRDIAFIYLGCAGIIFKVEDRVVAIDIGSLLGNREIAAFSNLDLLLFTHTHYDHYHRARTRKMLEKTSAHIVAQQQVAEDLKGRVPLDRLTTAKSGISIRAGGFEIISVNGIHPRPISIYRIRKGKFSVFHGGDSGYSPVKDYPAEVAFLPTGDPSPSCSPESALKFTIDLKPSVAVAMHGKPAQMNRFKDLVKKDIPNTTVIIPKKYDVETVAL